MNASSFRRLSLFVASISLVLTAVSPLVGAENEPAGKGAWIDREDGTKLNLLVEGENFELHFYDAENQPIAPDAAQAVLHYTSRVIRSRETLALLPAQQEQKVILTSPRTIRPPYQFDILLVLNFDEADKKVESHHLIFMQEAASTP